jgi:hypothetical protein
VTCCDVSSVINFLRIDVCLLYRGSLMYVRVTHQKSIVYIEASYTGIFSPVRILYKYLNSTVNATYDEYWLCPV